MAIATIDQLKAQLAFTDDIGTADDALLSQKLEAAQGHVDRLLGFAIEATFGGTDQDPVPPSLVEAVLQLAGHWYEHREGVAESLREIPYGVSSIIAEYREFTW